MSLVKVFGLYLRLPLLMFVAFFTVSAWGIELVSMKDFLKEALSGAEKTSLEKFSIDDEFKKQLAQTQAHVHETEMTFYYGKSADGGLKSACTIVGQKGKEGPMTVGVCFQPDGVVERVVVLNFVEERGKSVGEAGFLKQFKGKKVTNSFVVGQDVDGITGATYSSKAVAEATRKAGYAFKKYVLDGVKK